MEQEPLDREAPLARLGQAVLDVVEIAVVHVDLPPVDPQPGAAVEDTTAPAADLGDLPLPPERTQVIGLEVAAVVDGEIPVAVGPMRPGRP